MTTRFRQGNVTVTLDGGLEKLVRRVMSAAETETVRVLEAAAEEQRAIAAAQWYAPGTGVTRRTGRSGDLEVVTTLSDREARVSLQSTDTSRDGSRPRAAVIRRPGPLSLVDARVSQAEWWAHRNAGKPVGRKGTAGASDWVIRVINPNASDGRVLLSELLQKPMRVRIRALTPILGRAIARKAGGT